MFFKASEPVFLMSLSGDFVPKSLKTGTSGQTNQEKECQEKNQDMFEWCKESLSNVYVSFGIEVNESMKTQGMLP